jgi:putative ABC transport system permease protein
MKLVSIGVVVGVVLAFGVTRFMQSLLFGVAAVDPLTFVLIPLVLSAVAFLAAYIPARSAASVNPTAALRYE